MKNYFQGIISKCPANDVLLAPGPSYLYVAETGDGEFKPEENTANAERIRDTWNACHGLDLPADVPPGVLAEAVAGLSDLLEQASRTDAGGWHDISFFKDYVAKVASPILAKLTPAAATPDPAKL